MRIAIIDDQEMIRYSVKKILKKNSHEAFEFSGAEDNIVEILQDKKIEILILDVMLEFERTGIEILQEMRKLDIQLPVILMTAFTTPQNVIKATQLNVVEILKKPFEEKDLIILIDEISKESIDETDIELSKQDGEFVGSFETMKDIYQKIGIASKNDLTVLISGETGTGKELVANLIHQNSNKKSSPFLSINCASIPSELFESQLFGHEKGSFTGADRTHIGYAEQVEGGTLFLDEIGELEMQLQSKILRFLENKTFRRIGGKEDIIFKGRILAATNIDFKESIKNSTFREDLYYRLSIINIKLPNLNQRKDDIPLLSEHFIHLANKDLQTSVNSITKEAIELLKDFNWSGNIRELRNTIYNAVLNAKQEKITTDDLNYLSNTEKNSTSIDAILEKEIKSKKLEELYDFKEHFDRLFLENTVKKTSNISLISQSLNISRATLRKKLKEFNINYKVDN